MTATATASREARAAVEHSIGPLQMLVLNAIRKAGTKGLTDEEGQAKLSMNPNTYRPRRIELQTMELIQIHPVGAKQFRRNAGGRRCAVFVAQEAV
jgi:hypothetical protein